MHHKTASLALAAAVALATASPASAKTTTWKSPDAGGRTFKKLAVFVITKDPQVRRTAEDLVVTSVGGDSKATASHTFVTDADFKDQEKVVAKVKAGGYDGAIVFRLIAVDQKTNDRSHPTGGYYSNGSFEVYWSTYGVTGYTGFGDRYAVKEKIVQVESTVYSATDSKLVWAAQTTLKNPDSPMDVIEDVIKATVRGLRKDKLVK